jgi:hypothetical protein
VAEHSEPWRWRVVRFIQFIALFLTMCWRSLLGMGMPAVPAYINAALLMGPVLAGLGMSLFTAHMFIFYFRGGQRDHPARGPGRLCRRDDHQGRADGDTGFRPSSRGS